MESVLIQANAKVNLDFKIVGKKPDGYHLIKSLFQSIDLADFLLLEKPSTRAKLGAGPVPHRNEISGAGSKKDQMNGAIVCPDSKNIILKAKKMLEEYVGRKLPCKIHLQKSVPISAGLGGGSADGAAILQGLNLLYNLKLKKEELVKIGVKISADIPFFFYGGTCLVEGIGEKIKPAKAKLPKFILLLRPHKRLETKMMYELYDKTGKDFFTLAKELCPDIKKIEDYFSKFKIKLKLSGSGPSVFGEVNDYKLAKKIIDGYYSSFNGDIFLLHPAEKSLIVI